MGQLVSSYRPRRRRPKRENLYQPAIQEEEEEAFGYNRIHFHSILTEGLSRSPDGLTVHKKKGFHRPRNGISFSNRPVFIGEVLIIEVTNVAVVVGFIRQDPQQVMKGCPKTSSDLVGDPMSLALAFGKEQHQMIEMYFNYFGDVHCSVNGRPKAIIFSSLPTSTEHWALIELYNSDKNLLKLTSSTEQIVNLHNLKPKEPLTCCVCLDAPSDARISPCEHEVMCFSCASKWSKVGNRGCPFCRASVKRIIAFDLSN